MSFGEKMDESFEATKRRDENFWADSPLASDESFGDVLNEVVPFKRTMINNIEESPSPIRPISNKKGFGIEETLEVDVKKVYQEVDEVNLENFFPSKSHRRHSSSSRLEHWGSNGDISGRQIGNTGFLRIVDSTNSCS